MNIVACLKAAVFSIDALFNKWTYLRDKDLVESYSSYKPSFLIFCHTKMAWPKGINIYYVSKEEFFYWEQQISYNTNITYNIYTTNYLKN